jgi:hypothetical protein
VSKTKKRIRKKIRTLEGKATKITRKKMPPKKVLMKAITESKVRKRVREEILTFEESRCDLHQR